MRALLGRRTASATCPAPRRVGISGLGSSLDLDRVSREKGRFLLLHTGRDFGQSSVERFDQGLLPLDFDLGEKEIDRGRYRTEPSLPSVYGVLLHADSVSQCSAR